MVSPDNFSLSLISLLHRSSAKVIRQSWFIGYQAGIQCELWTVLFLTGSGAVLFQQLTVSSWTLYPGSRRNEREGHQWENGICRPSTEEGWAPGRAETEVWTAKTRETQPVPGKSSVPFLNLNTVFSLLAGIERSWQSSQSLSYERSWELKCKGNFMVFGCKRGIRS